MNRQVLVIVVAGLIGLVIGAFAAYGLAQHRGRELDRQRVDLMQAMRGVDLQNRLAALRLLREHKVKQGDIHSMEISAAVLADNIDLTVLKEDSQSLSVLQRVSKSMADYRRDFPESEFEPSKHKGVARLLSIGRS